MDTVYQNKIDDCNLILNKIATFVTNNPFSNQINNLNSYAVIKASGCTEVVFKSMIVDIITNGSSPEIKEFLKKSIIDSSINPSFDKIIELIKKFDSNYKTNMKNKVTKDDIDKLNSLVSLRNTLAHGYNINPSINDVINYFASAINILQALEDTLNKI